MRSYIISLIGCFCFLTLAIQSVSAQGFGGGIFDDAAAQPAGLGGHDSRCTGSTQTPVAGVGFKIQARRSGELNTGNAIGNTYAVSTLTHNGDYTVTVNLPYPPPDPANAWQCACNANPLDAFQCVYTNQDPDTVGPINVYVKRANVQNNAWWQVRGGNVFSRSHIQSLVPVSFAGTAGYCNTTLGCLPALIGADRQLTQDSPGFAFSTDGLIHTHQTGATFLHEPTQRSTNTQSSITNPQASLNGFSLPTENYDYFFRKIGKNAQTLPSSQKPAAEAYPAIFSHAGSLTIGPDNPWYVAAGESLVVFISGDLIIDDEPGAQHRLIAVDPAGGFLMFIVKGSVIVTPNVGYNTLFIDPADPSTPLIEGVFVADNTIWIQGYLSAPDRKFIGAGTFVGWTGVNLQRSFATDNNNAANNVAPAETFVFRPDFVARMPAPLKAAHTSIREVQPKTLQ